LGTLQAVRCGGSRQSREKGQKDKGRTAHLENTQALPVWINIPFIFFLPIPLIDAGGYRGSWPLSDSKEGPDGGDN
jgi:hypothetical protein